MDNHYIVRANSLEDNVVLHKLENGQRIALAPKGSPSKAYGAKHRAPKLTWCTLAIAFHGGVFTVNVYGENLRDLEDFIGGGHDVS